MENNEFKKRQREFMDRHMSNDMFCKCEDKNTDYHLTVCCAEKILINKEVAKKWADEMLAQAKYARLSPQSLVDLLNEIRKGLSE